MDRSKWEYKKLGDLCSKLTDGSHNPPKGIENSDYRMISSQNIFNDKIVLNDYRYLSKEDFETEDKRTALKKGDLLLTIVGAIGRCYVLNGTEGNLTLQRSVAALTPKDTISSRFLMYYFIGNNANLLEEAHGAAQKGIYLRQLSNLIVPVPTLDDQQRIVAELDCLNEMISLKQEQLKEFDKLAQSIFYDLFGDIESNSKGFKNSQLGKVCQLKAGKAIKAEELHEASEGIYPCYGGNGIRGFIDRFSHEGLFPIIGRQGALCGNINIANGKFYATEHAVVVTPLVEMDRTWLAFVLHSMHLEKYAHGVAQPGLSVKDLNPLDIITPPLSLQQQFAEKIQAIEAQKELVKQSIAETQHLLDSRMDYYFD